LTFRKDQDYSRHPKVVGQVFVRWLFLRFLTRYFALRLALL
jgi:hypothetical protein